MVRDEIRDDMQLVVVGFVDEFLEVFDRTETGFDLEEIRDVVPMVRRGFIKWGDPESCNAKVDEIGKFIDDSSDCSSKESWLIPVVRAVKSCEPIDENMVNNTLFHPIEVTHEHGNENSILYYCDM